MPAIQSELRVQIQGGQAPLLIKRDLLEVNSCEQISLYVDGVKAEAQKPQAQQAGAQKPDAQKPDANKKKAVKKKPQKNVVTGSYKLDLANVRFIAIYDAGQANGLRVKVPGGKFTTLAQPLVFMERDARSFGAKPTILLENESALPRTAVMLVGSDLPKEAKKIEQVKRGPAAAKGSGKKAGQKAAKKKSRKK
jgi:hypothetical protein